MGNCTSAPNQQMIRESNMSSRPDSQSHTNSPPPVSSTPPSAVSTVTQGSESLQQQQQQQQNVHADHSQDILITNEEINLEVSSSPLLTSTNKTLYTNTTNTNTNINDNNNINDIPDEIKPSTDILLANLSNDTEMINNSDINNTIDTQKQLQSQNENVQNSKQINTDQPSSSIAQNDSIIASQVTPEQHQQQQQQQPDSLSTTKENKPLSINEQKTAEMEQITSNNNDNIIALDAQYVDDHQHNSEPNSLSRRSSLSYINDVDIDASGPYPYAHAADLPLTKEIIAQTTLKLKRLSKNQPTVAPDAFIGESGLPYHSLRYAIHRVLAERRLWQRLSHELDQVEEIDLIEKKKLHNLVFPNADNNIFDHNNTTLTKDTNSQNTTATSTSTTPLNNNSNAIPALPNDIILNPTSQLTEDQAVLVTQSPPPVTTDMTHTDDAIDLTIDRQNTRTVQHKNQSNQLRRVSHSKLHSYQTYKQNCISSQFSLYDIYNQYTGVSHHFLWQLSQAQNVARLCIINQPKRNEVLLNRGRQFDIANLPPLTDTTPLTREWIKSMLNEFRDGKILSYGDAFQILRRAAHTFLPESNCVTVKIPKTSNCTVIGDLHGQLDDLLMVFREIDLPNNTNYMLFNGDFVDRGAYSNEVVLSILAFRALDPTHVLLNRGNHECSDMNAVDGFQRECELKYNIQLYWFFNFVFATLPVSHIIQIAHQRIFVVHAGLSFDDITINDINNANRFLLTFPMSSILQDLIWSDPFDGVGRLVSRRGAGCQFGIDVVQRFLIQNNIHLILRSHECEDNGFALWFENRLYTIFSASDYCGDSNNYGAFCVLSNAPAPQIRVYMAKKQVVKYSERMLRIRQALLIKLMVRIKSKIFQIEQLLIHLSYKRNTPGFVPTYVWSYALSVVLSMDLPFIRFASKLGININAKGELIPDPASLIPPVVVNPATGSNNKEAIAAAVAGITAATTTTPTAPATMYHHHDPLALSSSSSSLSPSETSLSESRSYDSTTHTDESDEDEDEDDDDDNTTDTTITGENRHNSNGDSISNKTDVIEEEKTSIAQYLDGKIMINILLWTSQFKPHNNATIPQTLAEHISALLYDETSPYRSCLDRLFRFFDDNNDGFITSHSFHKGLLTLLPYTNIPSELVVPEAIDELISQIDRNDDHELDYEEFFRAFGYGNILIDDEHKLLE